MMNSILRGMFLAVMAVASLGAGAADAADAAGISERDAQAIRAVIAAQLDAMAADDAPLAFSYASPSVRNQFGDAPSFMTMVREGYPMLIGATETVFLRPESTDTGVLQVVHLLDQDGRSWLATYHLVRVPDKSWRINGCMVRPDEVNTLI